MKGFVKEYFWGIDIKFKDIKDIEKRHKAVGKEACRTCYHMFIGHCPTCSYASDTAELINWKPIRKRKE